MPNCFGDKPPTADEAKACQAGQDTGDHMVRALHEYQQARFGSVHVDYLKIFRDRLKNALQSRDSPPLLVAKVEVELFAEQIEKLKSRMFDETVRAMTHWLDVADKVGARSEIELLLKQSAAQFCQAIGADALKIAESYAELLRDADAAWRQKYPEKISDLDKPLA
jgi:hypothetical protein